MFRRLTKTMFGLALLAMAGHTAPAQAAPITLLLTYAQSGGGTMTGSGSVTFDDSLLAPNLFTVEEPPTSLDAFSLTVFDPVFPGGSTSFALADLSRWFLVTGVTGGVDDIMDLNFVMDSTNSDGFSISGQNVNLIEVCDGPATGGAGTPCAFVGSTPLAFLSLIDVTVAVPEPATIGLFGAGLVALGWARRRRVGWRHGATEDTQCRPDGRSELTP